MYSGIDLPNLLRILLSCVVVPTLTFAQTRTYRKTVDAARLKLSLGKQGH